jgi:hypothetical protein
MSSMHDFYNYFKDANTGSLFSNANPVQQNYFNEEINSPITMNEIIRDINCLKTGKAYIRVDNILNEYIKIHRIFFY